MVPTEDDSARATAAALVTFGVKSFPSVTVISMFAEELRKGASEFLASTVSE